MPFSTPPFPPGSLVVAYLRDSGGDDQELSTQQQQRAIETWCKQFNLIPTRFFIDQASPGSSVVGRKRFQEMIAYFHQKDPQPPEKAVIVWSFSRFARNIDDSQFYKADLRRSGYEIFSLNDANLEGLNGRLIEAVVEWANEKFLVDLSANAKRGVNDNVEIYGALGGTPPRGFKRQVFTISHRRTGKVHNVARWVPDPDTWEICRLAWKLRSNGSSYREISERTHLYRSTNSYPTFFSNPIYKGELHFGDKVVKNYCEALVDDSTWEKVQQMRMTDSRIHSGIDPSHPRTKNSSYALSSLLRCSRCGATLIGKTVTFKSGRDSHQYYECGNRQRSHSCDLPKIPREFINDLVIRSIRNILADPAYMDELIQQTNLELDKIYEDQVGDIPEAEVLLSAVDKKINRMVDAIADRGHTPALLEKLDALEEEKREIKSKLITPVNPTIIRETILQKVTEISTAFEAALAANDIPGINRQLRLIAKRILLDIKNQKLAGYIEYALPVDEASMFAYVSVPPRRILTQT